MSHDDFDDGLVHSHGWASDAPMPPPAPARRMDRAIRMQVADERDDDGLVHGHAWARGSEH